MLSLHKPLTTLASNRIFITLIRTISNKKLKEQLDYTQYPALIEQDLEEQYIHGSGPGGQAVNKASNCVLLKHKPTGVIVKCHEHREAHKNAALARDRLLSKLDDHFNGDNSIANQIKRIEEARRHSLELKADKRRNLKKQFKESLKDEHQSAAA